MIKSLEAVTIEGLDLNVRSFAGFHKISVDVRYWLIVSVNTGANAGRSG